MIPLLLPRLGKVLLLLLISLLTPASGYASTNGGPKPLAQLSRAVWQIEQGLPQNSMQALVQTRDGYLWIGSQVGLTRFDGVRFTTFDRMNTPALLDNYVRALYEDHQGTLWIGTNGGLHSLRGGVFTSYTAREGLTNSRVETILGDREGSLWVGTNAGLHRLRDNRFTAYTVQDGLLGDVVRSLYEDSDGTLWVGTNAGLHRFDKHGFVHFAAADRSVNRTVQAIRRLQNGELLIGTSEGLYRFEANSFTRYEMTTSESDVSVVAIVEDEEGEVWVGTNRGMFCRRKGKLTPERLMDDNSPLAVDALIQDAERNLWVGTSGGGRYRFRVVAANSDGVWNEGGADVEFRLQPYFYQTGWFYLLCFALLCAVGFAGFRWRLGRTRRRERRRGEERFRSLIENASDMIMILDPDGAIHYHSPSVERMLINRGRPLLGSDIFSHVHQDDLSGVRDRLLNDIKQDQATEPVEFRYQHLDGTWRVQEAIGKGIRDRWGAPLIVVNSRDITDRKRVEEQLIHNAFHDPLTGLPNRALFMDRLTLVIEGAKRDPKHLFAVLFIDLDRFKVINDSLGHLVGDKLLVAIGRRLAATLRPGDTLARLGGDEFTILLDHIEDESNVRRVADRLRKIFEQSFDLDGHRVFATASIGVTLSTAPYERPEDLLRDADTAMYRAKQLGKDRHEMFDETMRDEAVTRLQVEMDLRRALEEAELRVHYQPIVSLASHEITGFEALVRWQHPERGLLAPGVFLPVAEETGLIVSIGWWVLEEACRQARQWQTDSPANPPRSVSVNLSSQQLMQPDLVERIADALRRTGCDPTMLKLEITENAMIDNAEALLKRLEQLKTLGVEFSIDDFGTGYSSLSYIHRFPVSTLKLDRSFVSRIDTAADGTSIVQTIVTLARGLGMNVVAEGVETEEQLAQLKMLQCEYGQGFLLHKPAAADTFTGRLRQSLGGPTSPTHIPSSAANYDETLTPA